MKILLVDDDNAVRNVLSKFLAEEDCSVNVAADGREALQMIENDLPDTVMTDIKMPVMDGLELLKTCREKHDIPFIMLTGFADMDIAVDALNNGAFYFIHKPINFYEILAVLNRLREKIELERKLEEQRAKLFQMSKLADLGLLTAGIVHEISDPVRRIAGNIEPLNKCLSGIEKHLLSSGNGGSGNGGEGNAAKESVKKILAETPGMLETMEKSCEVLSNIMYGMSAFTGLMCKSDPKDKCDLNECLEEALRTVPVEDGIEVKKALGRGLMFRGSKIQMTQAIISILNNAREALECLEQEKRLEIRTYSDDNSVFLEVVDNGPGIAKEHRERVFTPFFSTKPRKIHKGLGLSLAYGIIAAAGGEITCKGPESGGAVFSMSLPVG